MRHSYIASLGGYKITVSKDLLGYVVTLTDEAFRGPSVGP
jgi:hypothetical protein